MTLDDLLDIIKNTSRKIIEEDGQELDSLLFAVDGNDNLATVVGLDKISKSMFAPTAQSLLKKINAKFYAYITEAWSAKLDKDSPLIWKLLNGEIKVRDLPPDDREDIVSIIATERNGKPITIIAIIDNKPEGRRLRDFERQDCDRLEGRMVVEGW